MDYVLLSLICLKLWKINCYHKYLRNVKNEEGVWEQVAAFNFEDPEPFGHGEKLVFLISKFLRLTNGEAYAIRYHMGFQKKTVGEMLVKHLRSTHLLWLSMLQVVCDEFKDDTLSKLWKEHRDYFGNLEGDIFPLLIKILDAKTDLSIQVHPDDSYARYYEKGSLCKTECWYILDCEEDTTIIIGHNAKDSLKLRKMVEENRWNELLHEIKINKGNFSRLTRVVYTQSRAER